MSKVILAHLSVELRSQQWYPLSTTCTMYISARVFAYILFPIGSMEDDLAKNDVFAKF